MESNSKCNLCRREGKKLFLKGNRCLAVNCPINRKGAVAPGFKSDKRRRSRLSEYGRQLREKQALKRSYSLSEKQFRGYFEKAKKTKGETAQALVGFLESRLDSLVFRLGFAFSRQMARQLVSHGHVLVDGKKVDIPSYLVKVGETITFSPKVLKSAPIKEVVSEKRELPNWLERKAVVGRVKRLPQTEDVELIADVQAVVEYYSK